MPNQFKEPSHILTLDVAANGPFRTQLADRLRGAYVLGDDLKTTFGFRRWFLVAVAR